MRTRRDFYDLEMCAGESSVMSSLASVGHSALINWSGLTDSLIRCLPVCNSVVVYAF